MDAMHEVVVSVEQWELLGNWVLGAECWVLGSDAQRRHNIAKTGWESLSSPHGAVDSCKNEDECGGGI